MNTNAERAARAAAALLAYARRKHTPSDEQSVAEVEAMGGRAEEFLTDLLADLKHLADRLDAECDWDTALQSAESNHQAEVDEAAEESHS
jgi:hypothetical protein